MNTPKIGLWNRSQPFREKQNEKRRETKCERDNKIDGEWLDEYPSGHRPCTPCDEYRELTFEEKVLLANRLGKCYLIEEDRTKKFSTSLESSAIDSSTKKVRKL